jgi:hypothetical protein
MKGYFVQLLAAGYLCIAGVGCGGELPVSKAPTQTPSEEIGGGMPISPGDRPDTPGDSPDNPGGRPDTPGNIPGSPDEDPCKGVTCLSPPVNECDADGKSLLVASTKGVCIEGKCQYDAVTKVCDYGCESGACAGDPCADVTCNQPPANSCKDEDTLVAQAVQGTCLGGICSYAAAELVCLAGCAQGTCKDDPCLGVVCDKPPADHCAVGTSTAVTFPAQGKCDAGKCVYEESTANCSLGGMACVGGKCEPFSVPAPACETTLCLEGYKCSVSLTGSSSIHYTGGCIDGQCTSTTTECANGCDEKTGQCTVLTLPDPACQNMVCLDRYECSVSLTGSSSIHYTGGCLGGQCLSQSTVCANGCDQASGLCIVAAVPDAACTNTICLERYECGIALSGAFSTHYNGGCVDGQCTAVSTDCANGCDSATGQCTQTLVPLPDPTPTPEGSSCAGLNCLQTRCASGSLETHDGTCSNGQCNYTTQFCASGCSNGACNNPVK